MKEKQSAFELARVLAILGGIFTLVSGVLDLASLLARRTLPSLDSLANTLGYGIVVIILGVVALAASRYVKVIAWDIALVIIGALAYPFAGGFPWGWGPLLVVLGGIVGIIARLG